MAVCERCNKDFLPIDPDMYELCENCVNEIIADRQLESPQDETESSAILEDVMTCLNDDSPVQKLLDSPGVALTLAKLLTVTRNDVHMLTLNAFRVGAYLAFKQAQVNQIIGS